MRNIVYVRPTMQRVKIEVRNQHNMITTKLNFCKLTEDVRI